MNTKKYLFLKKSNKNKRKKRIINKINFIRLAIILIIIVFILTIIFLFTVYNFYFRKFIIKDEKNKLSTFPFLKSDNKTKVGLCIIGKKENNYIKEFVTHYKKLGYDHIFLYDNNDENDEKFEDILQDEVKEGFVSIINRRGYRGINNNPQLNSYYDCYEKYNQSFHWLSFFDIDEYLEITPNNITIQEFLDNKRYRDCQHIKINWLTYSDNDLLYYENKPLQERFTTKSNDKEINRHIKPIVKGNLTINYWRTAMTIHSSSENFIACSSSGKRVNTHYFKMFPDYSCAHLKHYLTKTIQEFCNKIKRGPATHTLRYSTDVLKKMFNKFFSINKKTKEKVEFFNKEFKTNFE